MGNSRSSSVAEVKPFTLSELQKISSSSRLEDVIRFGGDGGETRSLSFCTSYAMQCAKQGNKRSKRVGKEGKFSLTFNVVHEDVRKEGEVVLVDADEEDLFTEEEELPPAPAYATDD